MTIRFSRFVCLFLMLSLWGALCAQNYCVTIHFPKGFKGRVDCTFFDNDSLPHRRHASIKEGEAAFKGVAPNPHLVEVSHPELPSPLYFFLENANIDIVVNPSSPTASKITGSRSNSAYRYAVEDWSGDLLQFVHSNPSAPYTPFVLYSHLSQLDPQSLQDALSTLTGPARSTYHYRLLSRKLSSLLASTEGARMPDFVFVDDNKASIHFDSVRCDSVASLLLFTASFSQKGIAIANQVRSHYPQLKLLVINIDRHPQSWDAPYLEQLAIDRIPYMILLSPQGIIHTRDARIWELDRLLSSM